MKKKFNLSEKIYNWGDESVKVKDIKEFLRLLKEDFKKGEKNIPINVPSIVLDYNKIINKRAGKDLVK
ncbi:hypothetical protein LCGC14_0737790 [marine sediment metagenome]|uniref:Uncharacterized protein n=1 Tax=marine sediment metagenome TaxID=412755 RepID=A0A0F9TEV1_9ZZZZ